jgi:protein associated with RNAse G/E
LTEKQFTDIEILDNVLYIRVDGETRIISENKLEEVLNNLYDENEQLKQFPVKLDNRITKLQEDLQKLSKMDTSDLNPKAVEDVATVIGMSLNALLEFRKELKGDMND